MRGHRDPGQTPPGQIPPPDDEPTEPDVPDRRTVPLGLAAWAAAYAGTSDLPVLVTVAAVGVVAVAVASVVVGSARVAAVAVIAAAALGGGYLHAAQVQHGPVAALAAEQAVARVELRLTADPQIHPAQGPLPPYLTQRAEIRLLAARGATSTLRSPVLVIVSGHGGTEWSRRPVGSTVGAVVRLQVADRGADVAALARVRGEGKLVSPPSAGLRLVERVRTGLRVAVSERRTEQRALVPALVLGDTSALTVETTAAFQTTGLTHLTAVSGANLTLLLAFVLLAARWGGVRGWWLRLVALLGVVVFVGLCRSEPSVLRAAAMGVVALAALGTGSRRAGLRNLAVAGFALLLVDPWLSRSVGFVLSVLASGGIVCWARPWSRVLGRWLPAPVAEAVAVPLAAHLTTLPVVAAISGRVSIVGLWANALAGPFVGPATVLGFAAAGSSLISPTLAAVIGFGAAWSTQPISWVARFGAGFPGAAWDWPTTAPAVALLAALAWSTGLLMPHLLRVRALALGVSAVMVVGVLRAPVQPGWPPAGWLLVACDVGQGDGLVVRVGDRQAMVIDVGPDPELMDRCLNQLGVTSVPVLVLTHFHADHVDGLAAVLRDHRIATILTGPLRSPPTEAAHVQALADAAGVVVQQPRAGDRFNVGTLSWSTLGPVGTPSPAEDQSSVENDSSLVGLAEVDGVRLLLTGDVEPDGQRRILATGADLHADVLKIPHHGSARQDAEFFAASHARIAVVSAGLDNGYGHPAPGTIRLVSSLGMTLLRTDRQGSVAVVRRDGHLAAVAQRSRSASR
ncbi:MAG: ComEC/Rec2 family competence protein [Propionibacteriaceae bacterium]